MSRLLSLGPFTALDLSIESFIEVAAEHRLDAVSLMVNPPNPALMPRCVTAEKVQAVKQVLTQHNISVLNAECLMLTPKSDINLCMPAIEIAHQLGAKSITALLFDVDEVRIIQHLTQLADKAAVFGLNLNIEFLAMTPRWNSLLEVNQLLDKIDHPAIKICVDVLHLIRSGGNASTLKQIPHERIALMQICDGLHLEATADYAHEAGEIRTIPGEGVFPLEIIVNTLPHNLPIEIEVPLVSSESVMERLSKVINASKKYI